MRTQLKGVYASRRRRKDGKAVAYWYLRGFGALRPLPGDEGEAFAPGTPAFMRAYSDAISAPVKAGRSGTLKELTHDATLAAGCDGLHFHDLRGTTCTTLSEAGCTPQEIAAVLGWTVQTVNAMLDTYQAMTASLSDNAVAKLEARRMRERAHG